MSDVTPIIAGTEMEYGYAPDTLGDLIDRDILQWLPPGVASISQYLSNGSRFYVDMGHKVEYATPECLTVDDVVHAEFSGEKIVFGALSALVKEKKLKPYVFRKCVYGDNGRTWGYHENYLVSRDLYNSERHFPFLMGHFATQAVLTGAGRVIAREDGDFAVFPSQKMHGIEELLGNHSTTKKALVNTRDEPLCDREKWARQHVVCNDPNITGLITTLKIGSTKLTLRLGEKEPEFDFINHTRILPVNALKAARKVGRDFNGERRIKLVNERIVSALNIQEELLIQATMLSEQIDLPKDELAALELWGRIHDIAKYDPDRADKTLEYRAKRALIDAYRDRHGKLSHEQLRSISNAWDNIDPNLNIGRKWMMSEKQDIIDPELIEYFMVAPPTDTRASKRGNFIIKHRKPQSPPNQGSSMSWQGGEINGSQISLYDPFACSPVLK